MSYVLGTRDITEAGFVRLPEIQEFAEMVEQAPASATASRSGVSSLQEKGNLREGCFLTGNIDITNELAHAVPAVHWQGIVDLDQKKKREVDEKKIIMIIADLLRIVEEEKLETFGLDDPSNLLWLSLHLHRHHNIYATIFISASLEDLHILIEATELNNEKRQRFIDIGRPDPGRTPIDRLAPQSFYHAKFELVILHPSHFLIDNQPLSALVDVRGVQTRKNFYSHPDGLLRDEDGQVFPPFESRYPRAEPLNPLLVNLAAAIRVRRFIRQNGIPTAFAERARKIMNAVIDLHSVVIFEPTPNPAAAAEGYLSWTFSNDDGSKSPNNPATAGDALIQYFDDNIEFLNIEDEYEHATELDKSDDSPSRCVTPGMPLAEKMGQWQESGLSGLQTDPSSSSQGTIEGGSRESMTGI